MKAEITVHRVLVVSRDLLDHLANPGSGAALELMELEECLESLAPRVTVALMDCPGCLVRRDTEGSQDRPAQSVPQERMDREVKMERSDQGDWLARVVLGVCWDHVDHLDLPEPQV